MFANSACCFCILKVGVNNSYKTPRSQIAGIRRNLALIPLLFCSGRALAFSPGWPHPCVVPLPGLRDSCSDQSAFPGSGVGRWLVRVWCRHFNRLLEPSQVPFLRVPKEGRWFKTPKTVFRISAASHKGITGRKLVLALFFLPKELESWTKYLQQLDLDIRTAGGPGPRPLREREQTKHVCPVHTVVFPGAAILLPAGRRKVREKKVNACIRSR